MSHVELLMKFTICTQRRALVLLMQYFKRQHVHTFLQMMPTYRAVKNIARLHVRSLEKWLKTLNQKSEKYVFRSLVNHSLVGHHLR